MPTTFTGIQNENEFYSHHYLSEVFANDIRTTTARWRESATESEDRVKGLEFDRMVIASVNKNMVPLAAAMHAVDGPERATAETAERALLYVAATRARKELAVLSFGEPSPFLT